MNLSMFYQMMSGSLYLYCGCMITRVGKEKSKIVSRIVLNTKHQQEKTKYVYMYNLKGLKYKLMVTFKVGKLNESKS